MPIPSRRRFLKNATLGFTAATLLANSKSRAAGANDRVRVGVIGCGNQGKSHLRSLTSLKDAQIAYVSDIDKERLAMGVEMSGGATPAADFRRILDDKSIDGVTIATPDHWHAPIAILALDAGKHVYVEKPCCHNIREGQLLRRGGQARAARSVAARHAVPLEPGDRTSRPNASRRRHRRRAAGQGCWNWQLRKNIGHMKPSAAARHVDYDTWVGPAEMVPYPGQSLPLRLALVVQLRTAATWATTASTRSTTRCGDWASTTHPSMYLRRRRQVLLRRRPAVPRHAANHV